MDAYKSMKEVKVDLRLVDSVSKFVKAALSSEDVINVKSGPYVVNGKSLLGMFSLDLAKGPVTVEIKSYENADVDQKFLDSIKGLIV